VTSSGQYPPSTVFSETLRIQIEAAKLRFDWNGVAGPLAKLREETDELARAIAGGDQLRAEIELGDILFSAVNVARHINVDSESALDKAARRFEKRFERVKEVLADRGMDINDCSLEQMNTVWEEVKSWE